MQARIWPLGLVSIGLAAGLDPARAQCTPQWAESFPSGGLGSSIYSLHAVDDGGGPPLLYGGGTFGGLGPAHVAAWNGTSWSPLGSGTDGFVAALASLDDDGPGPNPAAIFAAGFFTTAGGSPAMNVARWNGSSWSPLGAGVGGWFHASASALAVFDDDGPGPHLPGLYAGGNFNEAGGAPANAIARWDGSTWSALGSGLDGNVHALAVFDDDGAGPGLPALYVGGSFGNAGGATASAIARWDGSTWSDVGGGVGGTQPDVNALHVFDLDGPGPLGEALYAGGLFATAGGVGASSIAQWDGASWSALGAGLGQRVEAISGFDPDGAGPGLPRLIARGSAWDGTSWSSLGGQPNSTLSALEVFDADGPGPGVAALYAGGSFSHVGQLHTGNCARWDGTAWSAIGRGMDGYVDALAVFDDDGSGPNPPALYAGGRFERAGAGAANHVARWDGSTWSPLGSGIEFPDVYGETVIALASFDADGTGPGAPALYAGGYFSVAGGLSANHVARWDGSAWSPLGSGMNNSVYSFAVYDEDGTGPNPPALFAGGAFTAAGGFPANHIARWNGSSWSPVGGGTAAAVSAMAVYDGDGGGPNPAVLCVAGGSGASSIMTWNGTGWFPFPGGTDGGTDRLAVLDEDDAGPLLPQLFVTGNFSTAGGVAAARIARWSGSGWFGVGGGIGTSTAGVRAMCAFDDDGGGPGRPDLYLAGSFTTAGGGVPTNHVARWTGSAWTTLTTGTGGDSVAEGVVNALVVFDEDGSGPEPSSLYLGGEFMSTGGLSAERVGRWTGCASSITSFCSGDGSSGPCPCGNAGAAGRGCQNSAGTGGALLVAQGSTALGSDSLAFSVTGELPSALTIVLQGNVSIPPAAFGDGLRCAGGTLKRLYVRNASGGALVAPSGSELPVSLRSAALGDPIAGGGVRQYQTYYRDPSATFCPAPTGQTWNASNGISVVWNP